MAREKSQAAHRIRSSCADTISAKSFINKTKAFKQTGLWPTQERSKKKKIAAAELPVRQRLSSGTTLRIGAKQLLINPLTSEGCVRQQASRDPADGNRTTGFLSYQLMLSGTSTIAVRAPGKEGVRVLMRVRAGRWAKAMHPSSLIKPTVRHVTLTVVKVLPLTPALKGLSLKEWPGYV